MNTGEKQPGRNDPCRCGSGKKYKHCCNIKASAPVQAAGPRAALSRQQLAQAYGLEEAGRFRDAGRMYEQLLKRHPNHPALLWGQGRCLMHFKVREAAATVLEQAVSVYPDHEKMVADVLERLLVLGKPEVALRISERGISDFPANTAIVTLRADALRAMGRDEDAIAVFRHVLEQAPGDAGVTLSLVNSLRNIGELEDALAIASSCLADTSIPDITRAGLLNEVARCEDINGNYAQAFSTMAESGAVMLGTAQARSIDSEPYRQRVGHYQDWIEANGLPDSVASGDGDGSRLVFLLGFPRSGTTLLESVLTAVPGVASSGEAPLIDAALSTILASGVSMENILDAMQPGNDELLNKARSEYWRKLKTSYGSDFKFFVDKQPLNTLYLPHIRILFPEARIIFCVRDPRDVCLSCFFQWFALNPTNKLFFDWHATADFYSRVMSYWFRLEPLMRDAAYPIRYEALVNDFPGQMRQLLEGVGIPWDDSVLTFADINRQRYYTTPSNRSVREGLLQDRTQRWTHYTGAIEEVSSLLSPIVERLGYS